MGHGIAQISAMANHDVTVRDVDEDILEEGLNSIRDNLAGGVERNKVSQKTMDASLNCLSGTLSLEEAVTDADLVIEAVPENIDLKQDIFGDIEGFVSDDTIIGTNTSSLSVTEIASSLDRPERAIGFHFFNPVHIMELVEVVVAEQTRGATLDFAEEFVEDIEKTAVTVEDAPGFASSRLGIALGVEAVRMVQEGVATPEDIDTAMELGYNHPVGPLELGDLVGLDVRLNILEYMREELGERFRPPQALKRKVRAGSLGKKTGEGFYVWEDGEKVGMADDYR